MGCNCKASKISEASKKYSDYVENGGKLGYIRVFFDLIAAILLFIIIGIPGLIISIIMALLFNKREISLSKFIRIFSNGRK